MADWTWETGRNAIKGFLNQAAELGSNPANNSQVKWCMESAKIVWKQIEHLRPPDTLTEASLKLMNQWKALLQSSVSAIQSGTAIPKGLPPLEGKPVDLAASNRAGFVKFKSIDPMLVLQLREWLLDYVATNYATEKTRKDYFEGKSWGEYYFLETIMGRPAYKQDEWRKHYPSEA